MVYHYKSWHTIISSPVNPLDIIVTMNKFLVIAFVLTVAVSSSEGKSILESIKGFIGRGDKPKWSWEHLPEQDVYVGKRTIAGKITPSDKIASFDFDDTIATTANGKSPFPQNSDDVKLWNEKLPGIFKELKNTHRIVLFSNQNGINAKNVKMTAQDVEKRFENLFDMMKDKELTVTVFAAAGRNEFRKPGKGMFDLYKEKYTDGLQVNMEESFFVGDAAGRKDNSKHKSNNKKDFSDGDFKFAVASKLKFLTPEQFVELGEAKDFSSQRLSTFNEQNLQNFPEKN